LPASGPSARSPRVSCNMSMSPPDLPRAFPRALPLWHSSQQWPLALLLPGACLGAPAPMSRLHAARQSWERHLWADESEGEGGCEDEGGPWARGLSVAGGRLLLHRRCRGGAADQGPALPPPRFRPDEALRASRQASAEATMRLQASRQALMAVWTAGVSAWGTSAPSIRWGRCVVGRAQLYRSLD